MQPFLRAFLLALIGLALQCSCFAQDPTFEAASVKLADAKAGAATVFSGGPGSDDPGRLRLHLNMSSLLQAAFGLGVDQIRGPGWLRDFAAMPFYDIVATMPPATTKQQVEMMLRNLLIERFHMVVHEETAVFPGYALVVDKASARMRAFRLESGSANASVSGPSGGMGSDGFPILPGPRMMGWRSLTVHQRIKYQEQSMAAFAPHLGIAIGNAQGKSATDGFPQPRVADETGLEGRYTFVLEYDCAACAALQATFPGSEGTAATGRFPEIFDAIQKQLGLRLDRSADVHLRVVVVDSIDKTPTEN